MKKENKTGKNQDLGLDAKDIGIYGVSCGKSEDMMIRGPTQFNQDYIYYSIKIPLLCYYRSHSSIVSAVAAFCICFMKKIHFLYEIKI